MTWQGWVIEPRHDGLLREDSRGVDHHRYELSVGRLAGKILYLMQYFGLRASYGRSCQVAGQRGVPTPGGGGCRPNETPSVVRTL